MAEPSRSALLRFAPFPEVRADDARPAEVRVDEVGLDVAVLCPSPHPARTFASIPASCFPCGSEPRFDSFNYQDYGSTLPVSDVGSVVPIVPKLKQNRQEKTQRK